LIGEENTVNIWDIEYPKAPIVRLNAHAQSHCLMYNPKDPPTLVTGMVTGQTAAYDVRVNNSFPVLMSMRENSHKDRVNVVTFYCSKTNMEFFSGSAAGEIYWWDLRNLEAPIDKLLLNPKAIVDGIKNDDKAFGVSLSFSKLTSSF
jgi:dynein intermediate chain 2, axonemal